MCVVWNNIIRQPINVQLTTKKKLFFQDSIAFEFGAKTNSSRCSPIMFTITLAIVAGKPIGIIIAVIK